MSKTHTKRSRNDNRPQGGFFSHLIPNKFLERLVPVVPATHQPHFSQMLHQITGAPLKEVNVNTTPEGKHICPGENNVCGQTPGGTKLVYSPSKHLQVEVVTPGKKHLETIDLYLLERAATHVTKNSSRIFEAFPNQTCAHESQSVIVDSQSQAQQPPRKTQKREKAVVGKSAKKVVADFFEKIGVPASLIDIEKEGWTLCHVLSYGIAMNGKTSDGARFNTQILENLFAGTRVLNENMASIENGLLQMIKDNDVKEIKYMAMHSEFTDSHILASLMLRVCIIIHNGCEIHFDHSFDITENRTLPRETLTAYYAFLKSIIDGSSANDSVVQKLSF